MTVFNSYARYYDLIYRDKDYRGEAEFIGNLLRSHAPGSQTVLELGCGTGAHAALLADAGYQVFGVDLSEDMLQRANARKSSLNPELAQRMMFAHGDVRTVRLAERFDAVISLFHVMSYQTGNDDLMAAFATANAHLKPGGVFIFDCWYGPAVLTDRPTVRVKEMADEFIAVTRIAEPIMYANDNLVDVNYHVYVRDKQSGQVDEIRETHQMRYLFKPEISALLDVAGFSLIDCGEWMTGSQPGFGSWCAYFVSKGL